VIERIEGEFLEVGTGHLLVNLGGIGIRILAPRSVVDRFQDASSGVLWTRLLVRDGEPQLYGFADPKERECFDALLAVTGVGARIALAVLSLLDPQGLALAVEAGSAEPLTAVPGVGRKLANRIILELKGRLPSDLEDLTLAESGSTIGGTGADAVRALTSLGYSHTESREAIRRVLETHAGKKTPVLDELVRAALTSLVRSRR
jgi:Holliday junction DNA helicase RuvA